MDDDENLNRWGAIPGGDELHNLDYDFDDYFSRHGLKAMSDDESRDFQARIYGQFCSAFYKSGGDPNAIPRALLHKSAIGQDIPNPKWIYAAATVWGVPSAVN
jgi:hypothetical protein